jgi:hypothetical protein
MSSGADWSDRMKRLAARAPGLSIFSSGYVIRDASGWQITDAGRTFLTSIEAPASEPPLVEPAAVLQAAAVTAPDIPLNVVQLANHKVRRRRRVAA